MRVGTVGQIWRFPVKSMVGERIPRGRLGARGLLGDRGWAVRDEEAGEIRGAKKIPRLLHFHARYLEEPDEAGRAPVEITLPDGTTVGSADAAAHERLSDALGRSVTLWPLQPIDDEAHYRSGAPLFPDDPMAELRHLMGLEADDPVPDFSGLPENLRGKATLPGTYFDAFPLHLLTTASLDELARLSPNANFDLRRFRPNILIDTAAGLSGFVEGDWAGRRLRIGEAEIAVEASSVRCAMTMQSQPGLEFDRDTLRTLIQHHGQHLGVYASLAEPGEIAEGDEVTLV